MDNQNHVEVDEAQLEKLDRVEIRGPASVEARFALGAELYFVPQGAEHITQLYRNLLMCVEQYYMSFKTNLNSYVLPNATRVAKIKGDPILCWHSALNKLDENYGFGMNVYYDGRVNEGKPLDATPWQISVMGNKSTDTDLSAINASMSICNSHGHNNFGLLFQMTLAWCERLKPAHGSAGFCFAYDPSMEPQTQWTWASLQRYPGIGHHDIVNFSLEVGETYNRIKGINWLTILGDEIVGELGGKEKIQAQLGDECAIHSYEGGIIIIAGQYPQLGDTYSNSIPKFYKTVSNVTGPVRFEGYTHAFLELPEPIDSLDATFKWMRRFD